MNTILKVCLGMEFNGREFVQKVQTQHCVKQNKTKKKAQQNSYVWVYSRGGHIACTHAHTDACTGCLYNASAHLPDSNGKK